MTRLSAPAEPRRTTTKAQKTPLEKLHAKAKRERHEDELFFQCRASRYLTEPFRQFKFHDTRNWQFDIAFPAQKVGIEVDGGLFVNGGHTRGAEREKDYERDAEAMMLGWRVLRVSPRHVKNGKAIAWIQRLLQ